DTDDGRGGIHVAYRHPVAAGLAAGDVPGEPGQRQDGAERERVAAGRRREIMAENLQPRRGDRARRAVVREPAELVEGPLEEELGGERRGQQVKALDAQAGQAEE